MSSNSWDTLTTKIIIPVNGEYCQQAALADIANQLGYEDDQIFIPSAGDVIEYRKGQRLAYQQGTSGHGEMGSAISGVLAGPSILSEDGDLCHRGDNFPPSQEGISRTTNCNPWFHL